MRLAAWGAVGANPFFALGREAAVRRLGPPADTGPVDGPGPFAFADRARVEGLLREAGFEGAVSEAVPVVLRPPEGVEGAARLATELGPAAARMRDAGATEEDKAAIRALQEDVPLTPRPFDLWGRQVGLSCEELLERAYDLQRRKIMRRFSAVLYHRKAGFRANAMGVWKTPPDRVEEVGQIFAQYQAVSHCYQRPVYEDWPYALFSMVHGRSEEECEAVLDAMAAETGLTERASLYSTREYKKTRVRYFTPEMEAWEKLYAGVLR